MTAAALSDTSPAGNAGAAGPPAAAARSATIQGVTASGWTNAPYPDRIASPSSGPPSVGTGVASACAISSQYARRTSAAVAPRPYPGSRAAAHSVQRVKASSAAGAQPRKLPRQASAGSSALSSTNRSARCGNSCV